MYIYEQIYVCICIIFLEYHIGLNHINRIERTRAYRIQCIPAEYCFVSPQHEALSNMRTKIVRRSYSTFEYCLAICYQQYTLRSIFFIYFLFLFKKKNCLCAIVNSDVDLMKLQSEEES